MSPDFLDSKQSIGKISNKNGCSGTVDNVGKQGPMAWDPEQPRGGRG